MAIQIPRACVKWCERRDSNPHGLLHWNLNPARLPVPPRSRKSASIRQDGDQVERHTPTKNTPEACEVGPRAALACRRWRPALLVVIMALMPHCYCGAAGPPSPPPIPAPRAPEGAS